MRWWERIPPKIHDEIEAMFNDLPTELTGQIRIDVRDGRVLSGAVRKSFLERNQATAISPDRRPKG